MTRAQAATQHNSKLASIVHEQFLVSCRWQLMKAAIPHSTARRSSLLRERRMRHGGRREHRTPLYL